ncbi:MAG: sigma-70 RNA polymerase sigma factor region 4 domain-containing protein [Planctomycetota bacterium]|jgi:RNA polymerase sigma-70 factor (ECF subfamily)
MDLERSHVGFPPTQWTLIEALGDVQHPQRDEALGTLIERYWSPTYAYLRRFGRPSEEAAELTQAFFADVVMTRGLFQRADPKRGRLRSLLKQALEHYVRDQGRRERARAAGRTISFDELRREEAILAEASDDGAEAAFDRRWAMAVLEEALRRCEQYLRADGREKHWAAFEAYVVRPSLAMSRPRSLAEVAEETGFASRNDLAGALRTVRKRVLKLLQEVVATTAMGPEDQAGEYQFVVSLLT